MTTLGRSLVATGELTSEEDIVVEGRVHGQVIVRDATLIIAPTASVEADVRGARVIVRGALAGSVIASDRIVLEATASVTGTLSANRVVIAEGAQFNGRIDMDRRTIAVKIAQYKAEHAGTPI